MNAMSALYHIAQNDSPSLSMSGDASTAAGAVAWSDMFRHFIGQCLRKLAQQRPTARELLAHPFVAELHHRQSLLDLIRKTKEMVRDLDNLQHRKMKKIIMAEAAAAANCSSGGSALESGDLAYAAAADSDSAASVKPVSSSSIVQVKSADARKNSSNAILVQGQASNNASELAGSPSQLDCDFENYDEEESKFFFILFWLFQIFWV